MDRPLLLVIASLGVAGCSSLLLTPLVKNLAASAGAIDRPKARKVHREPIPTWGGLAILGGFLMATLAVGLPGHALSEANTPKAVAILLSCLLITLLGAVDDLKDLRPVTKLAGQCAAAAVLIAGGVKILGFSIPGGGYYRLLPWQSAVATLVWIVGITNTINLIDGLDGLAAGVSAIASAAMCVVALTYNNTAVAIMAAAISGSALGFLRHNFSPAKIFMGDAGSQLLGLLLAALAVLGTSKRIVVPVLILGVPVFDTVFAIFRRIRNRRPIFSADRGHLHHRLLDLGLSQRQVVLVLYLITGALGAVALLLSGLGRHG